MAQTSVGLYFALLISLSLATPPPTHGAAGQAQPTLHADLVVEVPEATSAPSAGISIGSFVELGEQVFFTAFDYQHGTELWVTDGSSEAELFLDLCPGKCQSFPRLLVVGGDRLFFFADDGVAGIEPWVSDGTRSGTQMVADTIPGPGGLVVTEAVAVGDRLVFLEDSEISNSSDHVIWASDGTAEGTQQLREFSVDFPDHVPPLLTRRGEQVLFGTGDGEIFATDGTAVGTRLIQQLPGEGGVHGWKTVGEVSYFNRQGALWITEGEGDAQELADIRGSFGDPPLPMVRPIIKFARTPLGLFFLAAAEGRCALWSTDDTPAGTQQITLLRATETSIRCPRFFVEAGGLLYFEMITPGNGEEIWVSDGTSQGTHMLDLVPGPSGLNLERLVPFSDQVYFNRFGSLWRTNGTVAGTEEIFAPETVGFTSGLRQLSTTEDRLYFGLARDGERLGEIWNVTPIGSVAPIATFPVQFSSSNPQDLYALENDKVLFSAVTDSRFLWSTTAQPGDVEQLTEENEISPFQPTRFTGFGDGVAGISRKLFETDGSFAGTETIADLPGTAIARVGDLLYISSGELWRSDGTEAGTFEVKDIFPGIDCCTSPPAPNQSRPHSFIGLDDDTVLFVARDERGGALWRSDGTEEGTQTVRDLAPEMAGSEPTELRQLPDGRVLFAGASVTGGRELWITDGTAAGTSQLVDLVPGGMSSSPRGLTLVDTRVFFVTEDLTLWASDGSSAGTTPVADLAALGAFSAERFRAVGERLYFTATSAAMGRELWTSDGTSPGTFLVADLYPGPSSSNPSRLTAAVGSLFFVATDGVHGYELWRSGGSAGSTYRVTDLDIGARSSAPEFLRFAAGNLYFAASRHDTGRELWSLAVEQSLIFSDGFESGDLTRWSGP